MDELEFEDEFLHYGTKRHSGRYPWGSGKDGHSTPDGFLAAVKELKDQGYSEKDIAAAMGLRNTAELRAGRSIALNEVRASAQAMAVRLKEKGMSNQAIAERMGLKGESSVRNLLSAYEKGKTDKLDGTVSFLKSELEKAPYLDIGRGTDATMGITNTHLNTAVAALQMEGYNVYPIKTFAVGTGLPITVKVLAPPGVDYATVARNPGDIRIVGGKSNDFGKTFEIVKPPVQLDSKRLAIRYGEDGGADADGVMYIRPGVPDLALGNSRYAQVRIAVDGTHYLKGMAVYKEDLPDGVDIMFNTPKKNTGNKLDALKPLGDDEDRPFGAVVSQAYYTDASGKRHQSVVNIVNEEGDWDNWSTNLSAQMLSKQPLGLAKQQLGIKYDQKKDEYDAIMALTNPTVKKRLLESFSDDVDSLAVDMKAAGLPRQATKAILPIKSMKETEVYAPHLPNGEPVVLIRFPHGGKFEIPELTVNNKNPDAKKILSTNPRDAIGINPKVAERLSGADFDGDTVLVIPNRSGQIKSAPALQGLKSFDPKTQYPYHDGMKVMTKRETQIEMGKISNLINDMTLKGASETEIAAAVRHSMVVIDANKHKLNYKQSEIDNGISALKDTYQSTPGSKGRGASTLISRAGADVRVNEKRPARVSEGGPIDPLTGKKNMVDTGNMVRTAVKDPVTGKKTYDGPEVHKTVRSTKLAETDDAHTLSSGTPMERLYADHSNKLKALANQSRKSMITTQDVKRDPEAAKVYAEEVGAIKAKVIAARQNAPKERQAQITARLIVKAKKQDKPEMDDDELKKVKRQALVRARAAHGAKPQQIEITPREWEAIERRAISPTLLREVLLKADLDVIKDYATPREAPVMGASSMARAKSMLASGRTPSEVAEALGVPVSTLNSALDREA